MICFVLAAFQFRLVVRRASMHEEQPWAAPSMHEEQPWAAPSIQQPDITIRQFANTLLGQVQHPELPVLRGDVGPVDLLHDLLTRVRAPRLDVRVHRHAQVPQEHIRKRAWKVRVLLRRRNSRQRQSMPDRRHLLQVILRRINKRHTAMRLQRPSNPNK